MKILCWPIGLALLSIGGSISGQCVSSVCAPAVVRQQVVRRVVQQPVKQQAVRRVVQQPVKQRVVRQAVQQQVYANQQPQQLIEEQVVVEGDNSEVLFFVSPEFRRNQLYPQRQEQLVGEELLLAIQELRTLVQELRPQQPAQSAQRPIAEPAPDWQNPPQRPDTISAVRANCVIGINGQSCHGGAQPASIFNLEGNQPISDLWFRKSLEQLVTGEMPKDHELDQVTKNRVLIELLSRKP